MPPWSSCTRPGPRRRPYTKPEPMDENLIGYLLNALEPDESRQVEAQLRYDAGARSRLAQLRRLLDPLHADAEPIEPPAGLAARTLRRVAALSPPGLPMAPPPR